MVLQVWRAHRAQFFSWQQKRAEGENGAVEINPGRTKKLQDHIQALRVQYEVRATKIHRTAPCATQRHISGHQNIYLLPV